MSTEPQNRAQAVPKHLDRKMMISSGRDDDREGGAAVWTWMDALARKALERAQATSATPGMKGAQKA